MSQTKWCEVQDKTNRRWEVAFSFLSVQQQRGCEKKPHQQQSNVNKRAAAKCSPLASDKIVLYYPSLWTNPFRRNHWKGHRTPKLSTPDSDFKSDIACLICKFSYCKNLIILPLDCHNQTCIHKGLVSTRLTISYNNDINSALKGLNVHWLTLKIRVLFSECWREK